jgi:DNA-binding transcriptional MerR regulator
VTTTDERATDETAIERLLRIQEVAAETGLTTRAVRYYEEVGLLRPVARSGGDYRLYDPSDIERLQYIKNLRDVAGFSIAEIAGLLEDEDVRVRNRAAYQATEDPVERRRLLAENLERVEHQVTTLRAKIDRLEEMVRDAEERRGRLRTKLAEHEAGPGR